MHRAPPVIVCIPLRDEAQALPTHLTALSRMAAGGERVELCFYLDGCVDGSERVLRDAAASFRYPIHIEAGPRAADANAGRARRAAMAMGLARLDERGNGDESEGLLFTTDADSRPAHDWIEAGAAALSVADVAAGRIVREDAAADPGQSRLERYYDRLFACRRRLDPVPWEADVPHHYGGGANMAVRAATYRALGGFRPLPYAEDATLLDDAARAGRRVRRDGAMLVETSSRRNGRATCGLASTLRSLDAGDVQEVAHPYTVAWQAQGHALARRTFAAIADPRARSALAERIGLTGDHVLGVARDCPNGEAFAMRIVPACPVHRQPVRLGVAEAALAELEAMPCEAAA